VLRKSGSRTFAKGKNSPVYKVPGSCDFPYLGNWVVTTSWYFGNRGVILHTVCVNLQAHANLETGESKFTSTLETGESKLAGTLETGESHICESLKNRRFPKYWGVVTHRLLKYRD